MGLEGFQEELDFLTGRYAVKRRPFRGRLFQPKLSSSDRARGKLDKISVEGSKVKMTMSPRFWRSDSPDDFTGASSSLQPSGSEAAEFGQYEYSIPFINFINSPPRLERHMASREINEKEQEIDDDSPQTRRSQRKSYSSPLFDPKSLRGSRTVHFESPRSASRVPHSVIVVPDQFSMPEQTNLPDHDDIRVAANLPGFVKMPDEIEVCDKAPDISNPIAVPEQVWETNECPPEGDRFHVPDVVRLAGEKREQTATVMAHQDMIQIEAELPPPDIVTDVCATERSDASETEKDLDPDLTPLPVSTYAPLDLSTAASEDIHRSSMESLPESQTQARVSTQQTRHPRTNSEANSKGKSKPRKDAAPENKNKKTAANKISVKTPRSADKSSANLLSAKPAKARKTNSKPVQQSKPFSTRPEPRDKKSIPVQKLVHLPISPPDNINPRDSDLENQDTPRETPLTRAPKKRKERVTTRPAQQGPPTSPITQPPTEPTSPRLERSPWVSNQEEEVEESKTEEESDIAVNLPYLLPPPLPGTLQAPSNVKNPSRDGGRISITLPVSALKTKPRWGQKTRDTSLSDEAARARLAEERRKRHQELLEKRKNLAKSGMDYFNLDDESPGFEDYGFLSKYCILNPSTTDKYRHVFDSMDEGAKGYLTDDETAYGLQAINPSLSSSERTYLFRILEIAGPKMPMHTDLRLFSILAALSQKVSLLDQWAKNMLAEVDYKNLERKLFLCKMLWECNVDENSNTITFEQVVVELRAGGISPEHEQEVRSKLGSLRSLNFFDFLMYVPLFIMIHESVVSDPLSDSRVI